MSGRGRTTYQGRGTYRGGRGQGRGAGRTGKPNQDKSKSTTSTKMKFAPRYSGKQQMATYDTVKDY